MERFENYFIIDYSPRRFKAKCKICEMIFIAKIKNFNDFKFLLLKHLREEHNIRFD